LGLLESHGILLSADSWCGSVLNFYGSSSSSPEQNHEGDRLPGARGIEAHAGNCQLHKALNAAPHNSCHTCISSGVHQAGVVLGRLCREIAAVEWPSVTADQPWFWSWVRDTYGWMRGWDIVAVSSLPCGPEQSYDNEVASFTCFDLSDLSVSTTPAITSSASPPVSPPVRSTSVAPPQTPPPASPPVLVIVLGVVLLLLLVPLLILIQQNRVMRRAVSKMRQRTTTEAVYEEIQHRHNHFTQR
ncbi:hypothetical protein cypCar_00047028, partial [Cyprinus carpio]